MIHNMRNIPHIRVLLKERASTKKKKLCALWLACPILLSSCSGTIGNIPDNPSTDIEPSVAVSTPAPVKESAPAETGPQETTILIEPDLIVEEPMEESAEPNVEDVSNGDLSAFAGVYTMYESFDYYGYPPTIVLEENGRISGQMLSGETPIYVTQNNNGAFVCTLSSGEQEFDEATNMMLTTQPREFYVICPIGVTSGFDGYPDYDYLGTDTVRIRYMVIDGGILDIMYHRIG